MKPLHNNYTEIDFPDTSSLLVKAYDYISKYIFVIRRKSKKFYEVNEQLKHREKSIYGIFRKICELLKTQGAFTNDLFIEDDILMNAFYFSGDALDVWFFISELEIIYKIDIPDEKHEELYNGTLLNLATYVKDLIDKKATNAMK